MQAVLLIEDDRKLSQLLSQGLREHGFTVEATHEGLEGIGLALERDFDAIILDLMLPGKNGFEILKDLRRKGKTVPVLILTARSGVEDRIKGLDLGADDYLPKPFDLRELVARVRAISRRSAANPQSILALADLELDPVSHTVKRGGTLVELSAKEFALLEYLLRHKRMVVTRSMILDHVWGLDYVGISNLVDVYINYVRRKVDHDPETRLIHTIRGVGYSMKEHG
ncbi:MAG: response regulator transcription factor [Acidobacteria bacterium]|nr:response regulator transcription factor [Acidobacteriota bacterium]